MKKIVRLLMSIFLIINTILGYLAGAGNVPEELFFRVFIGSFILCGVLWFIGKIFSSDGNY